jgi:hypothetical protein
VAAQTNRHARSIWRKQQLFAQMIAVMLCQFMDGILLYGAQNQIKLTSG